MGGSSANVVSNTDTLGGFGGNEKHKLTIDEMPIHNYVSSIGGGSGGPANSGTFVGSCTTIGNYLPHNKMPPYLIMNYIIKF
tara:strand:+ start:825 stop:1070 length:246 start_codon:yes stop_codon:yes gene_type:complete